MYNRYSYLLNMTVDFMMFFYNKYNFIKICKLGVIQTLVEYNPILLKVE